MQRRIVDLPCKFGPILSDWIINVRGRSAGDGVTGQGQVVMGVEPRWEARLDFAAFDREMVLMWRTFVDRMRGRVNVARLCVCDMYRPLWKHILTPEQLAQLGGNGLPHSDESYHNDDTGYQQTLGLISNGAIQRGATSFITTTNAISAALRNGHFFSHNDWLYRVTGTIINGDGTTTFEFEPPMRRPVEAGSTLLLEAKVLVVFETDLEGRLPLDLGRFGNSSIRVQEWISRDRP